MNDKTLEALDEIAAAIHMAPTIQNFLGVMLADKPLSCVVRHEAAFAMGEIRKKRTTSGENSKIASAWLMAAVREDKSAIVQHEALEALSEFPEEEVTVFLKKIVNSGFGSDVRETATVSLAMRARKF